MKKLLNLLAWTLALNFLAVAGAVGWLYRGGRLDRERASAIKAILFPPPPASAAATQPAASPATQPALRLEELLARQTGRPPAEQLEFIQRSFDSRMAQLDAAQRQLQDLQRQVDLGKKQLASDRAAVEADRKKLQAREQEIQRLAADKGFQDSLALYQSMPAKQVKELFMTLDDQQVVQYLQAMEPRSAAKITKEFKAPAEIDRLKKIMDKLRQAQAAAPVPQTQPSGKG